VGAEFRQIELVNRVLVQAASYRKLQEATAVTAQDAKFMQEFWNVSNLACDPEPFQNVSVVPGFVSRRLQTT
jgi:hypothetical protein